MQIIYIRQNEQEPVGVAAKILVFRDQILARQQKRNVQNVYEEKGDQCVEHFHFVLKYTKNLNYLK
jgi:hypothetical protein